MLLTPQYWILQCWWTRWRSDVNRNKEGETGRSECEVTKTRYLEAEELREIWDLSWKSSFQTKLGHAVCVILTSVLRRSLLSASLIFSTVQVHLAVSHSCSFLLVSTLCPAVEPIPLFFYCCSLRQPLWATYKMIYSLLIFQN